MAPGYVGTRQPRRRSAGSCLTSREPAQPARGPPRRRPGPGDMPAQVGLWAIEVEAGGPGVRLRVRPSNNSRMQAPIDPFAGPLLPEQILVLTYNVKAARELQDRLDAAVGPTVRARMSVSNFHSFCHQVLTEAAAEAGLPAQPGRPRRDRPGAPPARPRTRPRPALPRRLVGAGPVRPVHQPGQGRAGHARLSSTSTSPRSGRLRERYGPLRGRRRPARAAGQPQPARGSSARSTPGCASSSGPRRRGDELTDDRRPGPGQGRRSGGPADGRSGPARSSRAEHFDPASGSRSSASPRPTSSTAPPSRSSGSRSWPGSIGPTRPSWPGAAPSTSASRSPRVTRLWKARPNILRRWQRPVPLHPGRRVPGRQRRPDRADRAARPDARPTRQRHGRRRRRPVDLSLPGRQLRRLRRVRATLLGPPDARPDGADRPAHRPASGSSRTSARCRKVLTVANRLIAHNGERQEPGQAPVTAPTDRAAPGRDRRRAPAPRTRPSPSSTPSASSLAAGDGPAGLVDRRRPVPQAQAPRRDRGPAARRGHPVHRRRAACRCSTRPRSATSSRASGRSPTRTTTSPWSG